jgi:hypothetical protein
MYAIAKIHELRRTDTDLNQVIRELSQKLAAPNTGCTAGINWTSNTWHTATGRLAPDCYSNSNRGPQSPTAVYEQPVRRSLAAFEDW